MATTASKLTAAVREYLAELRRVRGTGAATEERSYYPALSKLLDAVGGALRPKVFSVIELGQQGAGHPDLGLFAANQVSKGQPRPSASSGGQLPASGVVEVKAVGDDGKAAHRRRDGPSASSGGRYNTATAGITRWVRAC